MHIRANCATEPDRERFWCSVTYGTNSIDGARAYAFYSGGLLQMKPARRLELGVVQVHA